MTRVGASWCKHPGFIPNLRPREIPSNFFFFFFNTFCKEVFQRLQFKNTNRVTTAFLFYITVNLNIIQCRLGSVGRVGISNQLFLSDSCSQHFEFQMVAQRQSLGVRRYVWKVSSTTSVSLPLYILSFTGFPSVLTPLLIFSLQSHSSVS